MEFFQRCNEDEEVRDMDKLPYSSSSSSSSSRWGMQSQFYDASPRFSYHHQQHHGYEGSVSNNENKRGEEVVTDGGAAAGGSGGGSGEEVVCIEREHMFDKVVTPSDVGKLNRLVIPKQHAEKYFPLDSTANEKGLLLNFEDRSGKPWRFRYSYWNSSQSYVMTKGWSRFVKEKKLYAGDIVSFERGAGESVKDRLYIDWRRRADVQDHPALLPPLPLLHPLSLPRSAPWGGLIMPPNMSMAIPPRDEMAWQRMNYSHHHLQNLQRTNYNVPSGYNVVNSGSGPIFYLRSSAQQQVGLVQGGGECRDTPMVFNSVPVVHGKASAKRVRLFGVNLDCPIPENPEYQFLDSTSTTHSTSHIPQIPHSVPPLQLSLYNNDSSPSESPKENTSMSLDLDM